MRKIVILLAVFIVTYLSIVAIFHWDYFKVGRILPPSITFESCDEAISEIKKYDWDTEIAVAVMKAESKCDAESKGDSDFVFHEKNREYGYSVGVFQIRILPGREDCDTFEIEKNVACAYELYKNNDNKWEDWSMFNSGDYKYYMWRTPW